MVRLTGCRTRTRLSVRSGLSPCSSFGLETRDKRAGWRKPLQAREVGLEATGLTGKLAGKHDLYKQRLSERSVIKAHVDQVCYGTSDRILSLVENVTALNVCDRLWAREWNVLSSSSPFSPSISSLGVEQNLLHEKLVRLISSCDALCLHVSSAWIKGSK